MDSSRLRELVDLLLEQERKFEIQGLLTEVNSSLSTLASAPQQRLVF
jgi:hypothetical protein